MKEIESVNLRERQRQREIDLYKELEEGKGREEMMYLHFNIKNIKKKGRHLGFSVAVECLW